MDSQAHGASSDLDGNAELPSSTERAASRAASGPWTVKRLMAWIASYLTEREVDDARVAAAILLAEVLEVDRIQLYMEPTRELSPKELETLRALVSRAGQHEPVQYLVGRWPFFGHDFVVSPCTMIPRPCTETLVTQALDWYRAREGESAVAVLDLCTGTGCIAVSLALGMRAIARPSGAGCRPLSGGGDAAAPANPQHEPAPMNTVISVVATDIVPEAAELARQNAARLGASIEVRVGDLWEPIARTERFDLVVGNPPYVTAAEYAVLDRNVRDYEPRTALFGGEDGLDVVRRLILGAVEHLRAGGLLLVEVGWKHEQSVRGLVSNPQWRAVNMLTDGDGIQRVLCATRTNVP